MGAFALASALFQRERTGKGQHIDLAMLGVAMMMQASLMTGYFRNGSEPKPHGNKQPFATNSAYDAKEGMVMIGASNIRQQARFWKAVGREDMSKTDNEARVDDREAKAQLIVKQLDYDLTPVAGLALVGHYLKVLRPVLKRLDAALPIKAGVANSDVMRSYVGLLVLVASILLALGPSLHIVGHQFDLPMPYTLLRLVPYMDVSRVPAIFIKAALLAPMLAPHAPHGTVPWGLPPCRRAGACSRPTGAPGNGPTQSCSPIPERRPSLRPSPTLPAPSPVDPLRLPARPSPLSSRPLGLNPDEGLPAGR
jgi:hypothetical protein